MKNKHYEKGGFVFVIYIILFFVFYIETKGLKNEEATLTLMKLGDLKSWTAVGHTQKNSAGNSFSISDSYYEQHIQAVGFSEAHTAI